MIVCDTSALAKFYVQETESLAVRRRLEVEDEVCLSELARPELFGIFHRRYREKTWTHQQFNAAIRQFARDDAGGFWTWLAVDEIITRAAAQIYVTLPATIFLRATDCIHLATALQHDFSEILTYDSHQAAAASALGLGMISA